MSVGGSCLASDQCKAVLVTKVVSNIQITLVFCPTRSRLHRRRVAWTRKNKGQSGLADLQYVRQRESNLASFVWLEHNRRRPSKAHTQAFPFQQFYISSFFPAIPQQVARDRSPKRDTFEHKDCWSKPLGKEFCFSPSSFLCIDLETGLHHVFGR
jgi:hypothetical protein